VEADLLTPRLLERIRKRSPLAAVVLIQNGTAPIRIQRVPEELARYSYREVVDKIGRHVLREYLQALLERHSGNVTKAALAAKLERESLHRLLRRHRVVATTFRRNSGA
jgi:transcriptional regulator of acetoin/glycerol metabolism